MSKGNNEITIKMVVHGERVNLEIRQTAPGVIGFDMVPIDPDDGCVAETVEIDAKAFIEQLTRLVNIK